MVYVYRLSPWQVAAGFFMPKILFTSAEEYFNTPLEDRPYCTFLGLVVLDVVLDPIFLGLTLKRYVIVCEGNYRFPAKYPGELLRYSERSLP